MGMHTQLQKLLKLVDQSWQLARAPMLLFFSQPMDSISQHRHGCCPGTITSKRELSVFF